MIFGNGEVRLLTEEQRARLDRGEEIVLVQPEPRRWSEVSWGAQPRTVYRPEAAR